MYTLTVPFPFGKTEIPSGIASNVYPFTVSPTVSRASTVLPAGASGPVTIMGACEVLKPGLVGAAPTTGAVDAAIAIPAMAATNRRRDNEWCMGLLHDDWARMRRAHGPGAVPNHPQRVWTAHDTLAWSRMQSR